MPNSNETSSRPSRTSPRSPRSSSSTNSGQRTSLRIQHVVEDVEQASISPPMRLTRKRAASLGADNANQTRMADLTLDSANANSPASCGDNAREQVCLCQPDPKIPRPRNAFILYRQHMQAQVVAQNPGLANPDISKIIGENWKNQPTEVKNNWKQLAEEEKQRHQRQYPGYRYQPRRAGKANGLSPVPAATENAPTRCPKCNGRYILTPSTPLTPFVPSFGEGLRSERFSASPLNTVQNSELDQQRLPTPMQPSRADSPRTIVPPISLRRHHYSSSQVLPTHYERDNKVELMSPTHEQKRRRLGDDPRYSISSPTGYLQSNPFSHSNVGGQERKGSLTSAGGYRPGILPGASMMGRTGGLAPAAMHMAPPPQNSPRHPYTTRSSVSSASFDESLRLPPLQTQVPSSSPSSYNPHRSSISTPVDPRVDMRESRARSLEAMIMTIPYLNKIRILSRISLPLTPPGLTSPNFETRGCVIAVEGGDQELLRTVGAFIENILRADDGFAVRCWDAHSPSTSQVRDGIQTAHDTEMHDIPLSPKELPPTTRSRSKTFRTLPVVERTDSNPFIDYLSVITSMHRASHQITKHVTTVPTADPSTPPTASQQQVIHQSSQSTRRRRTPIALFPHGFSLATSDHFASLIPINDSYAPIDHWQWMATLWRGIVGPDLTVYCVHVGWEEFNHFGAVEVRLEGTIVVRVLGEDADGRVDGKTARRLGFEVLEFVRGGEAGWSRS